MEWNIIYEKKKYYLVDDLFYRIKLPVLIKY